MATKETRGVMAYKDEKGDLNIHYPVTEAGLVTFDPGKSGLSADNMQDAINELAKGGGSGGGSVIMITFAAAFAGHQYTVTDGDDAKTGTVPEGLAVSVPIVNCSSTYTITAEADDGYEYYTTVDTGPYYRQYTATLNAFRATINVISPVGATITCAGDGGTQTITSTGEDAIHVNAAGTYTVTRNQNGKTEVRTAEIKEDGETVPLVLSMRYGYRKTKAEGDPYARITYLYDAEGMTPAHMNFDKGEFDYGDWGDVWFVKKNRPVMLRYDRTVDYELDHSDQTKRLGGGASDISNTGYEGNAMSEIPLGWVHRYEDETYEYEIVCEHQWDNNYKAYAHTRADGTVADCFYWSMFGGSGNASLIRSIADQTAAHLDGPSEINGCKANGEGWYTHTWSQRQYIRTLITLMGKSSNSQSVYGNGHAANTIGTLKDKGQFNGTNDTRIPVKVFYIEGFWGNFHDRTAGLINVSQGIYYKMTPEGLGYSVNGDVAGYTKLDIDNSSTAEGWASKTLCGDFGCIPIEFRGSGNTYECDYGSWYGVEDTSVYYCGAGAYYSQGDSRCGMNAVVLNLGFTQAAGYIGCGLSAEQPLPKEEDNRS